MLHLLTIALLAAQQSTVDARYSLGATVVPERGLVAVDAIIALPAEARGTTTEFMLGQSYKVISVDAPFSTRVVVEPTTKPWPGLQRIAVTFAEAVAAPTIRIRYSGPLNPSGDPPLNTITSELVEMNLDSMWLPIRSDLGARFTVNARIAGLPADAVTVAQGHVAAADGEVHIRRDVPDLDFAFAAVPSLQRASSADFELFARDLRSPSSQLYLKHGPAVSAFLENWLGPMPGSPARLVVVPRKRASGYARKGYIVFTEGAKRSETEIAKFTAHEFAHAWFANANATSEHRWLDESTAEYAALRYVEHALGATAGEEILSTKRTAAQTARSVQGINRGNAELYSKGTLLLFELEQRLGRSKMDSLIAQVARRKIGTTPEFLAVLSENGDNATAGWFATQLNKE